MFEWPLAENTCSHNITCWNMHLGGGTYRVERCVYNMGAAEVIQNKIGEKHTLNTTDHETRM